LRNSSVFEWRLCVTEVEVRNGQTEYEINTTCSAMLGCEITVDQIFSLRFALLIRVHAVTVFTIHAPKARTG
jgi:hypothetical protein